MVAEKVLTPTIAFLGTGAMGTPMASRLISAGLPVRVWNRSKERLQGLVEFGGVEASTPALAVEDADVVITMLPDGQSVEQVMAGADGATSTMRHGTLWLQMGTVGVEWTERLAALAASAGASFVDAPVSGSVQPASKGELIILASGPDEARGIAAMVFDVIGRRTFWLGSAGAGSRAKLVLNNWLVDLVEMVAETLRVSEALGLDPKVIVDILSDAPIGSPYAVAKARTMLDEDFTSNFALKHAFKDAGLALDAARGVNVELSLTESLMSSWQRAIDDGAGDLDLSVVYRYLEHQRGRP
jgi:3-hydroxyisobutyrate dehydrogenase